MYNKYTDSNVPVLADGDCLAIFVEEEEAISSLEFLLSEGVQREEKVFILNFTKSKEETNSLFSKISTPHTFVAVDYEFYFLNFLNEARDQALSSNYSGIRVLCTEDDHLKSIFRDAKIMHEVLLLLMTGSINIARILNWQNEGNLENIIFHPRLLVNGEAIPNPCFIAPPEIEVGSLPFKTFIKDYAERMKNSDYKLSRFPTNMSSLLESILESIKIGLVVGDRYGNMVLFNKEAQRIMKIKPSPLPYAERIRRFGNFLPDMVTPYPFTSLPLNRAIAGEQFEREPVYIKTEDLESGIWCESSGSGVRDREGNLVGGVVVFQDVTEAEKTRIEKEKLELRLQQSQKMESLGVLAGGIAHDFNNLLVGVLGNAEMLQRDEIILSRGAKHINRIEQAVLELSGLTKQLLVYAGLSPAKDHAITSLTVLISSMSGLLKSGVSRGVKLNFCLPENNLSVLIDEVQIRQVLLNLVMNSSDACKALGGIVNISLQEMRLSIEQMNSMLLASSELSASYAVIEVSDNGCGISEEAINKIFDPFYSSKGSGRGLGLSAVIGIIKNHKGALDVISEEGKGSTFRIYLPLAFQETTVASDIDNSKLEKLSNENKKILVIDDEPIVLEVAEALLTSANYQVVIQSSGIIGLQYLKEHVYNLSCVFIDLTLQDLSGVRIYEEFRLLNKDLPVIISSGFSRDLSGIKFSDDPNLYFLEKPYRSEALFKVVEEALGISK